MVERARLTDALALAAQPREREYAIHDETLRGFMLRVQPGGARSWVLRFRRGGKPRRVTLGQVGTVTADQARAAALALLAREKAGDPSLPPPASGPTLARFATEYVERRSLSWKPSTHAATMSYLRHAILPALGALRVDAVTRADVARWFHAYGRRRPSQRPTVDSVALIRFHGRPCRLAFTSFRLGRSGGFAMRFPRKAGRGTRLPAIFARWKAGPAIGVSLVLAQRAKLCRFSRTSLGLRCRHRGRRSIQGVAIASG